MADLVNFLTSAIVWLFTIQLSTLFHELGHCFAILVFTKQHAKVVLGRGGLNACFKIRRLQVHFRGFAPWIGFAGVGDGVVLPKNVALLASIGGPLVSLIIGILAFLFRTTGIGLFDLIMPAVALCNCYLFVCTMVPVVYPQWYIGYGGLPSDGYRVLQLVRGDQRSYD